MGFSWLSRGKKKKGKKDESEKDTSIFCQQKIFSCTSISNAKMATACPSITANLN